MSPNLFHGHFCLPNSRAPLSRPLLPPKQSCSSFTATSASQTVALLPHKTVALLSHGHFCLPTPVAPLFHGHFCLPNSRAPLSRPLLPLKQSRPSFTATSASQTVALLFHGHFCLPNSRAPLSRPLLPPKQSRPSFTATSASQTVAPLFHGHSCLPNSRAHLSRPPPLKHGHLSKTRSLLLEEHPLTIPSIHIKPHKVLMMSLLYESCNAHLMLPSGVQPLAYVARQGTTTSTPPVFARRCATIFTQSYSLLNTPL